MFGFDGEFRRRPMQSLGGTSVVTDREALLKKAAEERAKRNDLRRKNNGAIVLQSYTRSFVARQRKKEEERVAFDCYVRQNRDKIFEDEKLCYLLRRLVFFYNSKNIKDCERLIEFCQHILRKPERLLRHSTCDFLWLHRLRRLLDMCITQLNSPQSGQYAIPMRMLETFTAKSSIERFVEGGERVEAYLEAIFSFLIERDYFLRLRLQLEQKCPPLDGETLHAPNPFTEAIFQLIMRPLSLVSQCALGNKFLIANSICESFAANILSRPFTEPIRSYLLPTLAAQTEFPFEQILMVLSQLIRDYQLDFVDLEKDEINKATFTGPLSTTSTTSTSSTSTKSRADERKQAQNKAEIFTSFLMNSILILDRKHLAILKSRNIFLNYINIIAHISTNILKLPKPIYKYEDHQRRNHDNDSSDDDDDDDEECNDEFAKREASYNKGKEVNAEYFVAAPLSKVEKLALLEVIELLNDSARVQIIVEHTDEHKSDEFLRSLCEICHHLMVYSKIAIFEYKLLYTLAFRPEFIRSIWFTLAEETSNLGFAAPLSLISKGVVPKENGVKRTIPLIATFCMLFGRLLPTLHDAEFCDEELLIEKPIQLLSHVRLMPFSIAEIIQLSKTLKEISLGLVELAFPETRSNLNQHYRIVLGRTELDDKRMRQQKQIWSNLLKVVVYVLNQIHTRDLRLRFCPDSHWTVSRLDLPLDRPDDLPLTRSSRSRYNIRPFQPIRDFTREDYENGPPMSTKQIRSITILREIPFVVSFSKRVGILQGLVQADKMRVQGNFQDFLQGPSIMVTVRRSHLYEDAYDKLRPENEPDLRVKFRVQFISSLGLDEAGIDGGGVFREFLSELLKTAFDPNRGFFMVTTDNKLYPNPNVADLVPDNFEKHYYFIGRILGKAIYENLLVELPLAEFFLTKLAGKYADVDIHQLASLDPELYKNLLYLKDYEGDVSELGLDFTITISSFGQTQIVELKPNGQNIHVTASNRIEYLQLMADYKLNVQIKKHCTAFRRGLSNVLPVEWLYMFSNKELQILISGAEIPIDLKDLQTHCKYGGGYSPENPAIITFWKVVEKFNDSERRQLLKFVTSCSRPPLLGFKDLDPPFFIQNAGDMERLPTASTCTNLLKLPPFDSEDVMREKLLYAIQSGVGFELS